MPRIKSGTFDNKIYQNEYHKAMKTKLISFNPNSENDMKIWDHLQTKENQTGYIKNLIREDMKMTDKDFAVRAFLCRMDEEKEKPFLECLICPYGKKKDPDKDTIENMDCDVLKLYADIGSILNELK